MSDKTSATKEKLLRAAISVLTQNPQASIAQIGDQAGVGRVTVHRHFGSREQLLEELTLRSLAEMDQACDPIWENRTSATDALKQMIAALVPIADRFHFLVEQPDVWKLPSVTEVMQRQNEEMTQLIEEVKYEGGLAPDVPTAWIVATIESVVYTAWVASHEGKIARNDAANLAVRTIFSGLAQPSPPPNRPRRTTS